MQLPVTKIQRFSTHDGDGIRTTVFLKGCPLRCAWCHNPETQRMKNEILFIPGKCVGCGGCLSVCPASAHRLIKDEHVLNRDLCAGCGRCAEACPSGALQSDCVMMFLEEILDQTLRDRAFYGDAGGITLSGGEPMAHPRESIILLRMAKDAGLNTALETCGHFDATYIPALCAVTDHFLWDFKDGDDARHIQNTGVSAQAILSNLFAVDALSSRVTLLCIMVKAVNMDDKNFSAIADTFRALSHCDGVELLPYHPYGGSKNAQLGRGDNGRRDWVPSRKDMDAAKAALMSLGARVK